MSFHKTFSCLYVYTWYVPTHDIKMYYLLAAGIGRKDGRKEEGRKKEKEREKGKVRKGKQESRQASGLRFLAHNKHSANHSNYCSHPRPCHTNTV